MKLKLSNFLSYILNFYKNELKNSIIFKINNKKIKINTSSINYLRIEIRDIEINQVPSVGDRIKVLKLLRKEEEAQDQ